MIGNTKPLERAEVDARRRSEARSYCIDQLRRVTSGLNAALDGESSSTRSAVLYGLRRRALLMINELKLL